MTRRQVLAETLKLTGLLCVAIALPAGCGGGDTTETGSAKLPAERQAELDNMGKASAAASKAATKKK